uniref:FunD6 n=1 Tax=Streptosporangium sp. KD35 TaxID=2162663 RepID=A0A2U9KD29_9ACTN|nr:FunD6 [Streptosporangium sp. KD35]
MRVGVAVVSGDRHRGEAGLETLAPGGRAHDARECRDPRREIGEAEHGDRRRAVEPVSHGHGVTLALQLQGHRLHRLGHREHRPVGEVPGHHGAQVDLPVDVLDARLDPVLLVDPEHGARLVVPVDVGGLEGRGHPQVARQRSAEDVGGVVYVSVVGDSPQIGARLGGDPEILTRSPLRGLVDPLPFTEILDRHAIILPIASERSTATN